MKPKRVPGPAGKDPGLVPDGRPPGGGADGGALPLLHPRPGHSGGGVPRRHRAHPGGDGGGCGQRPLYLSQNHRAWMVTPFRLGLFYDWRNNGQPLMVIDRSGDLAGVTAGALHFWDGNSDQSQFHLFRLCGPARRRLRGGPLHPYGPVLRVHRSGTHRRHPPDRRDRRLLLGDRHPPWGHHLSPSRSADGAGPGRPSPVHL